MTGMVTISVETSTAVTTMRDVRTRCLIRGLLYLLRTLLGRLFLVLTV